MKCKRLWGDDVAAAATVAAAVIVTVTVQRASLLTEDSKLAMYAVAHHSVDIFSWYDALTLFNSIGPLCARAFCISFRFSIWWQSEAQFIGGMITLRFAHTLRSVVVLHNKIIHTRHGTYATLNKANKAHIHTHSAHTWLAAAAAISNHRWSQSRSRSRSRSSSWTPFCISNHQTRYINVSHSITIMRSLNRIYTFL